MSAHGDMVTAIATALSVVPNIGPIHTYRRLVTSVTDARDEFTAGLNTPIRFADVDWSRGTMAPHDWEPTLYATSTITVRMYRSLQDATSTGLEFRDTVEAAAVVLSESAGVNSDPSRGMVPVEVVTVDHRAFSFPGQGDVLVHYAELRAIAETVVE